MMQKVNVSQGKTKMHKMEGRRELTCIHRSKSLYRWKGVGIAVPMSMEIKKSDEEAKKGQRIGLTEKVLLCRQKRTQCFV
jgi:hypothetical protein